ncbi:MAG: HesA/MoeB/ThiF family protein [Pseudobdellovibrionaceae bacterium]
MNARFSRQINLPEIGAEGQQKLSQARVLCVGAGGLGSPVLLYLAAAGIGHIGIIDPDIVDESNLQRQVIFTESDIGKPKAACAQKNLAAHNSSTAIKIFEESLTSLNVDDIIPSYDIIIDGSDNFETKFLINDAAIKYGKVMIFGAIQGFDGMASVFDFRKGQKPSPCYRCLVPTPPQARIQNCAQSGIIGAVAGIIGITQALQAIQIAVDHKNFTPLVGKLWTIDMTTMDVTSLNLAKNPDCPACGDEEKRMHLHYTSPVCGIIPEISAAQIATGDDIVLIDVREEEEWDDGHIPGATHFPLSQLLMDKIPPVSDKKRIIVYCQIGGRSITAARLLMERGYWDIRSLKGGYEQWLAFNALRG